MNNLQFVPYMSAINPSFWHKMTQLKLDIDKLDETDRHIWGSITNLDAQHKITLLEVECTSFNVEYDFQNNYLPAHGKLLNKNTIEQFKEINKTELINQMGDQFWNDIKNGLAIKNPSILNYFIVLSFADLKKYQYFYWFAFPTLLYLNLESSEAENIINQFSDVEINHLYEKYKKIENVNNKSFFLVKYKSKNLEIVDLKSVLDGGKLEGNLLDYKDYYFCFADPSMHPTLPGWPIRNFTAFLLHFCPILNGKTIKMMSFRLQRTSSGVNCKNTLIYNVNLPKFDKNVEEIIFPQNLQSEKSFWVGWEKNDRGKFGPRLANMGSSMDPLKLAETSVDLNLKLMKWRLLPDINLDKIKDTKYLLLGSGTLGCSVSRILLGWGARNITFVDNGRVSFSNPVRQSLFAHEDCLNGGNLKAIAAAENLKKIFPSVNSSGSQINIPMPGHPIGESLLDECKTNVNKITELIKNHDVIFLLTDSRESRWLPTLIGAYYGKIVINAALGFDTYLVMRHGFNNFNSFEKFDKADATFSYPEGVRTIPGHQLGCYFCNDVTAPGNSLKDRTLDQQCTVTRPGISGIAGSLAAELAISILQHKNGPNANAFYTLKEASLGTISDQNENDSCLLGIIPHSIRGFLSDFTQVLPATQRYAQCIACSQLVLEEYKKRDFDFLLDVFNSSKCLEDVTGLTEIQKDISEGILEWSDSEDVHSE